MRRTRLVALVAVLGAAVAGTTASAGLLDRSADSAVPALPASPSAEPSSPQTTPPPPANAATRPDIVLVLMDDVSLELLRTMPEGRQMQRDGATFDNAFVVDSMCCPSRASIFTGRPPHLTGVLTNTAGDPDEPIGGFDAYQAGGNERLAFNLNLHDNGYTTGFVGKFMNAYEPEYDAVGNLTTPVIPGWTEFDPIFGGGYNGWGYASASLDDDGDLEVAQHPVPDESLSDQEIDKEHVARLTADESLDFIRRHRDKKRPYFLEIATYAAHARLQKVYPDQPLFSPMRRDSAPVGKLKGGNCGALRCSRLTLDDLAGYDDPRDDNAPTYLGKAGGTRPAPAWRTNPIRLTRRDALADYRDRARMVQSVDRLVGKVRKAVGPNTYVILTSDNGFHLGQHQLDGGKGTPYDSDTRVPLVVVGPGVQQGTRSDYIDNIDLAPTIEELAGLGPRRGRAGVSFADALTDAPRQRSRYVYFEHTYSKSQPGEVDLDQGAGGTIDLIPSYIAVRSKRGLLARFDLDPDYETTDYAYELYRYDVGWEDRNVFAADHAKPYARQLMKRLASWEDCSAKECIAARR